MESSLARNADDAVEHYRQHIQLTSDLIEELLQSQDAGES